MHNQSMIVRQDAALTFTFTPDALALAEAALNCGALIGRVTNADQNTKAVEAQKELKRVMQLFERERKAAKEPLLEAGRALDRAVAEQVSELEKEFGRISESVADFQRAEARRIAEEERLQREELARIEREKQAELQRIADEAAKKQAELDRLAAEAKSVEEQKRLAEAKVAAEKAAAQQAASVQEAAAAKVYVESRPITATRENGQIVKTDWEIIVTNPYELAKFHPDCVNITPRLGEIKAHLNAGLTIKGIKAVKVTKASVRTATAAAITV